MLAIIQARSSSKRFKKKILYKINNKPIVEHVYKKVCKSKKLNKVIVATSINKSDNELVEFLKKKKIEFFRGSLNNVADRLLNTAIKYKSTSFIRISADSPLIDYKIIERAIKIKDKIGKDFDIITNIFPRTFPKGQSVEIINTETLKKNIKFFSKQQNEHVTLFFYENKKKFKIVNFINKKKILKKNMYQAIDTQKDLKRILLNFKKEFIK